MAKKPAPEPLLSPGVRYQTKLVIAAVAGLAVLGAYALYENSRAANGVWLSGSSGATTDGSFASWRGEDLGIAGHWADNNSVMVSLPGISPGGQYGNWQKNLDIAIGAIGPGESWSAAAGGAYDSRWRQSLTNLKSKWGSRQGTLFIRFAHEMNGSWYPWKVTAGNEGHFIASWKRFRTMQKEIFPEAKLVFCTNRESVSTGFDWRKSVPGANDGTTKQWIDVGCVDYYNQYPGARTQAEFDSAIMHYDGWGAPKGLERHRQFWQAQGLPMSIAEWNNNASGESHAAGDAPVFFTAMYNYFKQHGGSGPGNILYEIIFNVGDSGQPQFWLPPNRSTSMPKAAETYRSLTWPSSTAYPPPNGSSGTTPAPSPPVVGNGPDLVVTSVSLSPANPAAGQPVTFSATIKNQGTVASPAGMVHGVAFEVGSHKTWSDTHTASIAPGASVTVTANGGYSDLATWPAGANGSYSVTATADDVNRIPETNESNNTRTHSFSVGAPNTSPVPSNPADLNGDGRVNITDLSILLSKWTG